MKPRKVEPKFGLVAKAILAGILLGCTYGIVHDQITARICLEYFTIWHPPITSSTDPTIVGLVWGIVATWWAGAIQGLVIGLAAVFGASPRASFSTVSRAMLIVLAVSAIAGALIGIITWKVKFMAPSFAMGFEIADLPIEKKYAFSTCLAIHNASYVASFLGSLVAAVFIWRGRRTKLVE